MTTNNNSQHYDVYRVEKLLQSFSSYINSFDGSPHAFANAETIMSEVFHKDWIFMTDDGPKDLQWYRNFCKSFAEHGSIAKVLNFSQTENGNIQVTIENTINGVEVDPITYDGLVSIDENGQYTIKYFEPVIIKDNNKSRSFEPFDKNLRNVEKMIQLVSDCDSCSPSKD